MGKSTFFKMNIIKKQAHQSRASQGNLLMRIHIRSFYLYHRRSINALKRVEKDFFVANFKQNKMVDFLMRGIEAVSLASRFSCSKC